MERGPAFIVTPLQHSEVEGGTAFTLTRSPSQHPGVEGRTLFTVSLSLSQQAFTVTVPSQQFEVKGGTPLN